MKKFTLLVLLSIICVISNAQDVVITTEKWDEMRDEKKAMEDSLQLLKDKIYQLEQDTLALYSQISELRLQVEDRNELQRSKDSLVINTIQLNARISELNDQIISMANVSDLNIARLANGRLQRKYNKDQVDESLSDLRTIQSPTVKEDFKDVEGLLILYPNANNELKLILKEAQEDSRRKSSANMQQYISDYIGQIKKMSYYQSYYLKKDQIWTIIYLDEMIESAINILQKHNPGREDYADFTTLIELL